MIEARLMNRKALSIDALLNQLEAIATDVSVIKKARKALASGTSSSVSAATKHLGRNKQIVISENKGKSSTGEVYHEINALLERKKVPTSMLALAIHHKENQTFFTRASKGSLFNNLKRKALTTNNVRQKFAMILLAVNRLHSRNIVHLDLKPANILLDKIKKKNGRAQTLTYLGDLDTLTETSYNGEILIKNQRALFGTPFFSPNEYNHAYKKACSNKTREEQDKSMKTSVNSMNLKAIDSYALGKILEEMRESLTICPSWFSKKSIALESKLKATNPKERLTVAQAIKDPFFGKSAHATTYFKKVESLYETAGFIDHYLIEPLKEKQTNTSKKEYDAFHMLPQQQLPVNFSRKDLS